MDIILPNSLQDAPVKALCYDADELGMLVSLLREAIDPTQIILFGSLSGGTPHSDMAAYDLLVVTAGRSAHSWLEMRDYFRFKYPLRCRTIPFVNLYICTEAEINGRMCPFYRFVQSEGEVSYTRQTFWRKKCDYQALHFKAFDRFEFSFKQAAGLLSTAKDCIGRSDFRQAALLMTYAAELLLRALHGAYLACDSDLHELPALFLRTYTLSTELTLVLDPEQSSSSRMLARLENFRKLAIYDSSLDIDPEEVTEYLDRLERTQAIIAQVSRSRLDLYLKRLEESERKNDPAPKQP